VQNCGFTQIVHMHAPHAGHSAYQLSESKSKEESLLGASGIAAAAAAAAEEAEVEAAAEASDSEEVSLCWKALPPLSFLRLLLSILSRSRRT
jgi:hypothetical protein